MKDFLKYVLGTITGIFLLGILLTVVSVVGVIGLIATTNTETQVKENSVFVLKLDGTIEERVADNPFQGLLTMTGEQEPLGLDAILSAIHKAQHTPAIKGIYLEIGTPAMMPATAESIREALNSFKQSGKFVVSYADSYGLGGYYVASVANKVLINPQGMIDWSGMTATPIHFKDLLDKVGVKMQIIKVGTYKSAVEPYILNQPSEANVEQTASYITSIWKQMLTDVAKSRRISADSLNAYADRGMVMANAEVYKNLRLVDKITYAEEVKAEVKKAMHLTAGDSYHTLSLEDMGNVKDTDDNQGDATIAVYYAYGEVGQSYMDESCIDQKVVCKELRDLRDNDDIKAVVLRLNTPGGSSYDGEQIWREVAELRKKKPVVVSMSDLTASAGYYIASAANYIVAQPNTLTGSIGVYAMIPDYSDLAENKLGIHTQSIKTNKFGDMGNMTRPMTDEEKALMQGNVNRFYDLFIKRCADGRKMKEADVRNIAEGRVWTGSQAKAIGLVDELGGLDKAIAKAKALAKTPQASIESYPAQPSIFENLMMTVNNDSYIDSKMKETFGSYYTEFASLRNMAKKDRLRAELPYFLHLNF